MEYKIVLVGKLLGLGTAFDTFETTQSNLCITNYLC